MDSSHILIPTPRFPKRGEDLDLVGGGWGELETVLVGYHSPSSVLTEFLSYGLHIELM